MKREALRHPKTYDLAARLNCSRPEAIGYLTLLFDFVADVALAGNIGRWPDGAIARACDWQGSPSEFVAAMVDAGWIDRDDDYRLVMHDWSDHAQQWMRAKAQKLRITLLGENNGSRHAEASVERSAVATAEASVERSAVATVEGVASRDRTEPNRTEPNPSGSGPEGTGPGTADIDLGEPILAEAVERRISPLPAGKLRGSVFAPITERNLKSVMSMVEWHARQLSARSPAVGPTEAHLLLVIAAAAHVMGMPADQVQKSRVGLFVGIVRKRAWERVAYRLDEARRRLDEFKSTEVNK